jgi:predicted AlkP superfamily phosphohydrolase/phosphomutase
MSSKDPGTLGIYGFRHRRGSTYNSPWTVSSNTVKVERVWEVLEKYGKRSNVIGLPPAYPPFQLNGNLVSCFLTPTGAKEYTYPLELKKEIESLVDGYKFDVLFRTEDRQAILSDIYDMTEKRFKVVQKLSERNDWDFFIFMEIGTDRLHHAFWKYYDKSHPKYVANNTFENVIPDYYQFLDTKISELILSVANKDTVIVIASDHGTKAMTGAICINEWLISEGLLVLKQYPEKITDIEKLDVDWEKTTAWGWGGYYARIFLNVEGREPLGKIKMDDYESSLEDLAKKIRGIKDPEGRDMDTRVFKPEDAYVNSIGDKPDLMVYFDNLNWRSAGTIGHRTQYLSENDTGPDDSVHSHDGTFIIYDPQLEDHTGRRVEGLSIYDVAPTILDRLNIPVPIDMKGTPLL